MDTNTDIDYLKEEKNKIKQSDFLTPLEQIDEKNELYESVNETEEEDQDKTIAELQQKIISLEKLNRDLLAKNEGLTKNNVRNSSILTRMSMVGLRKKFTSKNTVQNAEDYSVKLAEIVKEKDDLQEMNEKMLDLLTEKELENEELMQKLENYKLESKIENEKNLEKIQSLEDKIVILENNNSNSVDIDDIINEYNNYKERLKKQLNEYSKIEENLKQQLEMKDKSIQKLNEEIQRLELENLQLVNQSETKAKMKDTEIIEIEQLKAENEKIKREMKLLDEKFKLTQHNEEKKNKSHENEIIEYMKQIENEKNNLKIYKENKSKEIDILKSEITRNNCEINLYNRKVESIEKILEDEKQKNFMIQNKLDKKVKELQDMNEYTKKLLSNKDNLLSQYEEKIEEINKDKNNLINQNKELLEKIKVKNEESSSTNLGDILNEDEKDNDKQDLDHYKQENKLLNEEIKGLKEQLATQANDLVDLNSLEKEAERLRAENEALFTDNKNIKKQLEEQKKIEIETMPTTRRREFTQSIKNVARKTTLARKKTIVEKKMDNLKFEKQLNALKKMKEDERKDYEEQIEKLKFELAELKIQALNKQYETDSLLVKYRNAIRAISNECKKKGIKLKVNFAGMK